MTATSGVVLSNVAYLIGVVVLAVVGGVLVWLRHRRPTSVDANVETFHRGLRALAPERAKDAPARVPSGVTVSGRMAGRRSAAASGHGPPSSATDALREEGYGG